ncbi:conserved oligomeric Golgi complex subunit 5 [Iris pallida]|uniref:Conserved oligomeric Golgi complex subunit 5 n=1 Tax=Iris pallida TaxID=29817 RepID=A0AAX6ELI7_IRIPA|nr:conserved oligomeric Golgi complex subunit 5 [Iris pallida]
MLEYEILRHVWDYIKANTLQVIIDFAIGSVAYVVSKVEIVECEPLLDGQFYLKVMWLDSYGED